jgi:hypothetical protein
MCSKVWIAIAMFCFGIAAASAQMIQFDPSELNSNASRANDAKLVSTPPLSADVQQEFAQTVKDIHFDFDKSDLRPEDRAILAADADGLKAHPEVMITLEGDTDEPGGHYLQPRLVRGACHGGEGRAHRHGSRSRPRFCHGMGQALSDLHTKHRELLEPESQDALFHLARGGGRDAYCFALILEPQVRFQDETLVEALLATSGHEQCR